VDGEVVEGDVPAVNFYGRTTVPVRFVSETLGATVGWDAATWTVSVESPPTGERERERAFEFIAGLEKNVDARSKLEAQALADMKVQLVALSPSQLDATFGPPDARVLLGRGPMARLHVHAVLDVAERICDRVAIIDRGQSESGGLHSNSAGGQ